MELERKLQKFQVMYSSLNLLRLKCLHRIVTCLVFDLMFLFCQGEGVRQINQLLCLNCDQCLLLYIYQAKNPLLDK